MKNRIPLVLFVILIGSFPLLPACGEPAELKTGWIIGRDSSFSCVILHTKDGGKHWTVQGEDAGLLGFDGMDVSAVDEKTAWIALGSDNAGRIIHTSDGGKSWTDQQVPEGVGPVKQIRGLSRKKAWAVGLRGEVLRTVDGGLNWVLVPHPDITINQVNRIAVRGKKRTEMYIADDEGGKQGMIHMFDNGASWRREFVDYDYDNNGVHMVGAFSKKVAFCFPWWRGTLFMTTDGGESWENLGDISGPNDIDDICSPTENSFWAVQNLGGESGGLIFFVRIVDGTPEAKRFNPAPTYKYEGITCVNRKNAIAVGGNTASTDPSQPAGVIVVTKDGGESWERQEVPVEGVSLWKVSFVGDRF
ncbi:MAG TPA: YCF48-related protein [Acidobacteriota bacterium]|jgi:photosystem II stability/assembly factor-like uncharacterized protein|nr:YCF48-related protein [Acidobacteriota bacterium]HNT17453.1 YCF48-related protein [Acidobacteriota bacterium]HPA26191.1 YCF48-related protein [Acidobacteriota bacterium]HQO18749.1 YCF48-related protein [Acidobacteriota bacterium]HQQ46874.1 YCF48-related protein [Acidobacteriota bacterium]